MIYFDNWNIRHDGSLFARQYDNLSRRLDVIGNLPEGWNWEMLVQTQDAFDIIPLSAMDGGVGTVLSEQQLSLSGFYTLQLKGRKDSMIRHTNTLQIFVSESLSGVAHWPEIPSSFLEIDRRLSSMNAHPPMLGNDGFWMVWNPDSNTYQRGLYGLSSEIIQPIAQDKWHMILDLTISEEVSQIIKTFEDYPMRKILVMLETPAHSVKTNYAPVTLQTLTKDRYSAPIEFYPYAVPTTTAATSVYEVEILEMQDGSCWTKLQSSYSPSQYTRTQENAHENTYTKYNLPSATVQHAIWQPWCPRGETIQNHITGFQMSTYQIFPVGTHFRIWGVKK